MIHTYLSTLISQKEVSHVTLAQRGGTKPILLVPATIVANENSPLTSTGIRSPSVFPCFLATL